MKRVVSSWLLILGMASSPWAADLGDFRDNIAWQSAAKGVWRASIGNLEGELRYTDLAAAQPRWQAINRLQEVEFPFRERAIRYRIAPDHKVAVHIPTEEDEQIFGYGLQFDRTSRNGQILELKVDHFNKGGGATHAPVPFFLSSRGYGVFFNTAKFLKVYNQNGNRKDSSRNPPPVDRNPPDDEPQPGRWLARPRSDAIEAYLHGNGLELVVFGGTSLQDVVARYNLFSGGGALPPLWGLGFWHRVPAKFSATETLEEIEAFAQHRIPLDVIGLEPGWQTKSYPCTYEWQPKRFPDPGAFSAALLKQGLRLNLWENPYVSPEAPIYEAMYPLSGSHLVWLGIVPDYHLPAARKVLVDQHKRKHIDIGVSGYKIDEVDGYDFWLWPDHATFPSGRSAEEMRQSYGMLMQKMLFEDLFRKNNQRTYGLVRASNGAASGYPFVIYSDSYGHQQYITGLSAASLSGILWCPEIRSARDGREWLNRMHTVCFSPLAMLNAWASGQKPWSFADFTDDVRDVVELRMRLLPYLYTAFANYHFHGIPPVRSMLLEQSANGQPLSEDNSLFMFGPDILVAPFFEDQAETREITLPPGKWFDFHTGDLVEERNITRTSKGMENRVPLFVKDGAVIPMLDEAVHNTEAAYGRPLELRHYGRQAGEFELYEDDGKTFNYEQGAYRWRRFTMDDAGQVSERRMGTGPALFGEVRTVTQMTKP